MSVRNPSGAVYIKTGHNDMVITWGSLGCLFGGSCCGLKRKPKGRKHFGVPIPVETNPHPSTDANLTQYSEPCHESSATQRPTSSFVDSDPQPWRPFSPSICNFSMASRTISGFWGFPGCACLFAWYAYASFFLFPHGLPRRPSAALRGVGSRTSKKLFRHVELSGSQARFSAVPSFEFL